MKICIILSTFYPEISKKLLRGAILQLKLSKIKSYKIYKVNGTFEIPVMVSILKKDFDAFIVLGCIIKGETPHFNYLSSSVFNSILNLSTNYKIPIGNGLITCSNKRQAIARSDLNKINKGKEATSAVLTVLKSIS